MEESARLGIGGRQGRRRAVTHRVAAKGRKVEGTKAGPAEAAGKGDAAGYAQPTKRRGVALLKVQVLL